ncbi:MAG: hypothetical protein ACT6R7_16645 [Brevundimonas aurantiaca]|jgi:hypothetical protein|uniref:hypothetical protein n=1 Tax=Brevundimonas aurantiaca TaxID=74316 RepID=UPI004034B96E
MQQGAIDQLGLSPEATRVLKAQMESGLAGPAFWAGTIVGLVVSLTFFAVGIGLLLWTVPLIPAAVEAGEIFIAIPVVIGLCFSVVPLAILPHLVKVLKARRS